VKSRFELFEHKPTGRLLVVDAGWSWFAFLLPPLWAAGNGVWTAAIGMAALAGGIALTVSMRHEARVGLIAAWIIFSAWMAEGGHRWTLPRKLSALGEGEITYLGDVVAASSAEAERLARQSLQTGEPLRTAPRNAPPEHVVRALAVLNGDDLQ
jgi:hypothetical protein